MKNKVLLIVAHIAGWLVFFSLVVGFINHSPGGRDTIDWIISVPFFVFCLIYVFIFYLNMHVLMPYVYLKGKFPWYAGSILVLFIIVLYLQPFDNLIIHFTAQPAPPADSALMPGAQSQPPQPRQQLVDIVSVILFVTVWSLSSARYIVGQWRISEQRALQAETERAVAELSFLRAQINPHFLFNTLNNIYSLAVTNHAQAAPAIMKLSNIMRYVTDEVHEDYVTLNSELGCLQDYIDLQKMRLGGKTQVEFIVAGHTDNRQIAPLLLMTFVENAFKYGTSNHEQSVIIIKLEVGVQQITFNCSNKLFENKSSLDRKGTGIANARERLQRLYPGKHILDIRQGDGVFAVQLSLQA